MAHVYMPAMEAAEFAKWAAEALHRAGWNVALHINRGGESMNFELGKVERYNADELAASRARGAELAAALRVE